MQRWDLYNYKNYYTNIYNLSCKYMLLNKKKLGKPVRNWLANMCKCRSYSNCIVRLAYKFKVNISNIYKD